MVQALPATPDPTRAALLRSVFNTSSLRRVATAVSVATEWERLVYVEKMTRGWRWSLASRGNGYPLLRISARFLRMDHTRLMIGFYTLDSGVSILARNPQYPRQPQAWAMLEFDGPCSPIEVEQQMVAAIGPTELATDRGSKTGR